MDKPTTPNVVWFTRVGEIATSVIRLTTHPDGGTKPGDTKLQIITGVMLALRSIMVASLKDEPIGNPFLSLTTALDESLSLVRLVTRQRAGL